MLQAREFLIKKIYEGIEDIRKHPEVVHNDLLTKLLKEDSFSEEVIADFLLFLLFAGHDTSSRSMSFAIKFLTDCPQAFQELKVCDCITAANVFNKNKAFHLLLKLTDGGICMVQAEHDALLNRKGNPRNQKLNWDDYQSMKFIQSVCN